MNALAPCTALRKKLMQLDELHMYDVYTSLVPDCDKKISFDKAKEDVLGCHAGLRPGLLCRAGAQL